MHFLKALLCVLLFVAPLEVAAQASEANCTCRKSGSSDKDGARVANASECYLSYDSNRQWCSFDVKTLKSGDNAFAAALRDAAAAGDTARMSTLLSDRFADTYADPDQARVLRRLDFDPGEIVAEASGLIEGNARLVQDCLQAQIDGEAGEFDQPVGGDSFGCGVHPDTLWVTLYFDFGRLRILHLVAPR